ncbi:MAG: hypothetical protein IPL63_05895 [Saprospiraceae bacterium]|nr:hypothetical protein [Saprospiraceae bacterium]
MKNRILIMMMLLIGMTASAQINMEDTTARSIVLGKREKQNYWVTFDVFKVNGSDTTSRDNLTYDIEITVLTADEKSYTVEWRFKNAVTTSQLPALKNQVPLINGKKIVIKTNELGAFQEVVNWKELKAFMQTAIIKAKKEYQNDPEKDNYFKQIEGEYKTKETIEASAIKEILQFHNFHGGKYKLGEVLEGKTTQSNPYGPQPFDVDITVVLDEINVDEDNFTLRSWQEINKEQLADATFNYLTKSANSMKVKPPTREDVKNLTNETFTSSVVHPTGWMLFTMEIKTVTQGNIKNIEERIIELK